MTDQQPPNPDALRVGIERSVRVLERALADSLPAVRDALETLASAFTEPDPDRPTTDAASATPGDPAPGLDWSIPYPFTPDDLAAALGLTNEETPNDRA